MSRRGVSGVLLVCAAAASAAMLSAQTAKLKSTWAAPNVGPVSYAGKKVAAIAITPDMDVRMSAEEALAREITARGPQGIASYRAIPKELLADKDKAQQWFAKTGVAGVLAVRVVNVDTTQEYSSVVIGAAYYQTFWNYYDYGMATVIPIGKPNERRTYAVETLLYDIASGGKLLWAGLSETTDPKNIGKFVQGLAKAVVSDLEKKGLVARK
jgi:hypothetical protein